MQVIVVLLYVLTVLTVLDFALTVAIVVLGVFGSAATGTEAGAGLAVVGAMGGVVMLAFSLIVHGAFVVLFMGSAELLRISMDIQDNTHETAHHARLAGVRPFAA